MHIRHKLLFHIITETYHMEIYVAPVAWYERFRKKCHT